jgi:hypothetical protein
VLDAAGNVYVTGSSPGIVDINGFYHSDIVTIKYDTDGNEMWLARYNGPDNYDDGAAALAVDAAGNVNVTGYSVGWSTNSDYVTIKLVPNINDKGGGSDGGNNGGCFIATISK